MKIDIRHDLKKAAKEFNVMRKNVVKAQVAAINKTTSTVRTQSKRELAKVTGMTAANVNRNLSIVKASKFHIQSQVVAGGKAPNLIRFGARETKAGVSHKAYGRRQIAKGAFIGNNNRTVFKRTTSRRLPIKPLYGPSIPKEFIKTQVLSVMERVVKDRLPLELVRAFKRYQR